MEDIIKGIIEGFKTFAASIDWVYVLFIILVGQYWGVKFFGDLFPKLKVSLIFLMFATAAAIVYIFSKAVSTGVSKHEILQIVFGYFFATSLYELLLKRFFTWIKAKNETE